MSIESKKNGNTRGEEKNPELEGIKSFISQLGRVFIRYEALRSLQPPYCDLHDDEVNQEQLKEILKKELF